jgi:hypothetical protein
MVFDESSASPQWRHRLCGNTSPEAFSLVAVVFVIAVSGVLEACFRSNNYANPNINEYDVSSPLAVSIVR